MRRPKPSAPLVQDQESSSTSLLGSVREKLSVLNKQIKLERSDGKVRVVFDDPAQAQRKAREAAAAQAALNGMCDELAQMFARCPGSRRVMPHLAVLESSLKKQGVAAFDSLPQQVLQRASQQFETVASDPLSGGLAEIRSRLLVALTAYEEAESAVANHAGPSSFLTSDKLLVDEASVSDFNRVVRETQHGGLI